MSRRAATALFILGGAGVVLIAATLGLGWSANHTVIDPWTIDGHQYYFEGTNTFLPGSDYRTQCSTNNTSLPGWGPICADTGAQGFLSPYLNPLLPEREIFDLYQSLAVMVLTTVAFGIVGLVLWGFGSGSLRTGAARYRRLGPTLLLVAGIISVAMPVVVAVVQPMAFAHDLAAYGGGGPNPTSSFWGSCSPSSSPCSASNTTETWGPAVGWYLAFVAGGCFLVSGIIGRRVSIRFPSPANPPPPLAEHPYHDPSH
jgi:hypothetical protein